MIKLKVEGKHQELVFLNFKKDDFAEFVGFGWTKYLSYLGIQQNKKVLTLR